jgi:pyrroloquinoline quinone biosynthesis protein B
LRIDDAATGGSLVYAPGVSTINNDLQAATERTDCLLIDGTFWSNDEPQRAGITNSTAQQMGHVPVSGEDGTLAWLSNLTVQHRRYVHINNTNPMLNEVGEQWRQVDACGVSVGHDGDSFEI